MRSLRCAACAFVLLACGEARFPDGDGTTIFLRIENEDTEAAFVSYRVWDEGFRLAHDVLIDLREDPGALDGVFSFFPDGADGTDARFRGGLVEFETWDASLCQRQRVSWGFRYGVSETENELVIPAARSLPACRAYFAAGEGSDSDDCSDRAAPCREVQHALRQAAEDGGRFIVHAAGGAFYQGIESSGGLQNGRDVPNVVRAWPGRALPEAPVLSSADPPECDESNPNACNSNSQCIRGFCAPGSAINLCCQFDDSGPSGLEVDGFTTRGGRWSVEINGAQNVTLRHCLVDGGGAAQGASAASIPSGGVRIFSAPGTRLEHNRISMSKDESRLSPVLASGVLVDGVNGESDELEVELVYNRIDNSQRAGVFIAQPNGRVVLRGNAVCGSGGSAVEIPRGQNAVEIDGLLALGSDDPVLDDSGSADASADVAVGEGFSGQVRVRDSWLLSESGPFDNVPDENVERSLISGPAAGSNRSAEELPADVSSCLVGDGAPDVGLCAGFPFCEP